MPSDVKEIQTNNMHLSTEWKGRTGKYLVRGQGERTEGDVSFLPVEGMIH